VPRRPPGRNAAESPPIAVGVSRFVGERAERQPVGAGGCHSSPAGATLTLLRHGQSEWNRDRRFAGWADVDLSDTGRAEAQRAGRLLRRGGYTFDCCFTSVLRRATHTGEIVLRSMGLEKIPVQRSWRLNERHYGALQGMGLWPSLWRYGVSPVLRCRRFDGRPPQLEADDWRFPGRDPLYASLSEQELPRGESLADTQARVLPYWTENVVPQLARGRRVLVVSHKNTLRVIVKLLEDRDDAQMPQTRVPTAVPIVLSLDASLKISERRVLEDGDS